MRTIEFDQVSKTVESLCIAACYELPRDVLEALERAAENESRAGAAKILSQLVENAHIGAQERIPLCQDTGLTVVFVEQGVAVTIGDSSSSGPATIVDGKLKLTEIPARARFPISVEVVAYQFGSGVEPLTKTAEPAVQTIHIHKP